MRKQNSIKKSTVLVAISTLLISIMAVSAGPVSAAATVKAKVSGGSLTITGTNGQDRINLAPGFQPGEFIMRNEITNEEISLSGVTKDVKINMKNGSDKVSAYIPLEVPRDLRINLGSGHNLAYFPAPAQHVVGRDLRVDGGNGNDTVFFSGRVSRNAKIDLNRGNNAIQLDGSQFKQDLTVDARGVSNTTTTRVVVRDARVSGSFVYKGANGADTIRFGGLISGNFSETHVAGPTVISTGNGADELVVESNALLQSLNAKLGNDVDKVILSGSLSKPSKIDTGNGDDRVELEKLRAIHLNVKTGNDDDTFLVYGGSMPGSLVVDGGKGDDFMGLYRVHLENTSLKAGPGADSIALVDGTFDSELLVRGESGNDTLFAGSNRFGSYTYLNGGSGTDGIGGGDNEISGDHEEIGFETVVPGL